MNTSVKLRLIFSLVATVFYFLMFFSFIGGLPSDEKVAVAFFLTPFSFIPPFLFFKLFHKQKK